MLLLVTAVPVAAADASAAASAAIGRRFLGVRGRFQMMERFVRRPIYLFCFCRIGYAERRKSERRKCSSKQQQSSHSISTATAANSSKQTYKRKNTEVFFFFLELCVFSFPLSVFLSVLGLLNLQRSTLYTHTLLIIQRTRSPLLPPRPKFRGGGSSISSSPTIIYLIQQMYSYLVFHTAVSPIY